jgi:hypothetical protein
MLIELCDNNERVTHRGLVDTTQGYEIDALYTPTFRLSLFSVNQLNSARPSATTGGGKCFISSLSLLITITGHFGDLYNISTTASAYTTSTSNRLSNALSITVPSTLSSTDSSTLASSSSSALTVMTALRVHIHLPLQAHLLSHLQAHLLPSQNQSPLERLTNSETRRRHRRFAHMYPIAV